MNGTKIDFLLYVTTVEIISNDEAIHEIIFPDYSQILRQQSTYNTEEKIERECCFST
jgi:hypothetical protein